MQPPDTFMPTAERSSLACDLGRWALREAACRLAEWSRASLDEHAAIRIAVNVSACHAGSASIVDDVTAALAASGLAPDRLEIELSEATLADDVCTKLDRSFVASPEPGAQKLVALMIEGAHTFGLVVVAEGVDNTETLATLRELRCDAVQGLLIGRPMAADQAAHWLCAQRAA